MTIYPQPRHQIPGRRNFDPGEQGANEKHVILNEQALQMFSFNDPVSAVGQAIYVDDSVILSVIGVMMDFHFRPLSYQIGLVAFRYNPVQPGYLSAQLIPGEKESVVTSLESIWKKLDPGSPDRMENDGKGD